MTVCRFGAVARAAALAMLVAVQPGAGWAADRIGVAAATQNQVEGIQAGTTRALAAGSQIFQEETIRTGTRSMAQLLFLDETSLSVGPLSEVTLDRFVFDPVTDAGDVVLSATKGAFRFITGSQNPANYHLNTPFAGIGVRGTIVDCYVTASGIYCTAQEGSVVLVVNGVEYRLGPGEALYVAADGDVTGPFTPDGEFFQVAGIVPWPLYGNLLPGEHAQTEAADGATVLLDELFEPPCIDEYCPIDEPEEPYDPCYDNPYCYCEECQ